MSDTITELQLLEQTLGGMSMGPASLASSLVFYGGQADNPPLTPDNVLERITRDAGSALGRAFQLKLVGWDHERGDESGHDWTNGTGRNTAERRTLILNKLGLEHGVDQINTTFRVALVEEPLVIAEQHEHWYPAHVKPFYWDRYLNYLDKKRRYEPAGLVSLDLATTQAISRLSDPQRPEAYQSKGLVVGYVQSGKTTNFTGLIAKAIDSGYRLVIVLSGTQNMLRNQTQRRIDMELVGKEGIRPLSDPGQAHDYDDDPDWEKWFIEYGDAPRSLEGTNITRLTGETQDFKLLPRGLDDILNPGLERFAEDRPLYALENLERSNARLIVAKKNNPVLKKLVRNLQGMPEMVREQVPAVIIDDESDQASINTLRPEKKWIEDQRKQRTAINARISEMLDILKRSQYVGYTATPCANVFVDPDDPKDIFPKDFLISLPRPPGYMGVADFHDLDDLFDPNPEHDLTNEEAHVRSLYRAQGEDQADLQEAVDMFVLTGAIKLFRESIDDRYRFRHHTMLVHESVRKAEHQKLAERIHELWETSGYDSDTCFERLNKLFERDLRRVSADRGKQEAFPDTFDDLLGPIGRTIGKIEGSAGFSTEVALVVNSDRDSTNPDFDKTAVWKIILGGSKLSRGYTIEGLTISWFRRRSSYEDTIMQMGRWFGFRPGYQDLVRLYIARSEPYGKNNNRHLDLYEAFEGICRDEEALRQELRRYDEGGITPRQVPPLIQLSHPDLLPAAPSKMWNARIRSKNFGGTWIDRTLVSFDDDDLVHNAKLIDELVEGAPCRILDAEPLPTPKLTPITAATWVVDGERFRETISRYRWTEKHRVTLLKLELEFLAGEFGDPEVDDWVVIAPLLSRVENGTWPVGTEAIPIARRSVDSRDRIKVFTTPRDKIAAELIIGKRVADQPSPLLIELTAERRGVLLLYPVKATGRETDPDTPTMGLSILPPFNSMPRQTRFGVRRPEVDDIVVD
ncbi:MAG: endonuclease [Acidobacteria bacterium]|jgi:hypothetical protein|nr:endonuclease [Acidobacteriota bacterium]|tara:strand:- start:2537 stop:5452 length:2916 start_codon:yes stop_codon:yes gene_type:complete